MLLGDERVQLRDAHGARWVGVAAQDALEVQQLALAGLSELDVWVQHLVQQLLDGVEVERVPVPQDGKVTVFQ